MAALEEFCVYAAKYLGAVQYTHDHKRFCIIVPPEGSVYVHKEIPDNYFLKEFIEKVSGCPCTIEEILQIFYHYSDRVKYKKITDGEFDYMIYFEDGKPDSYRYCIKFEENYAIYHRFIKADYDDFGF